MCVCVQRPELFLSLDSGPDVCPVLQKYKKPLLLNSVPNVMSMPVFFSKRLSLSKKEEGNHIGSELPLQSRGQTGSQADHLRQCFLPGQARWSGAEL